MLSVHHRNSSEQLVLRRVKQTQMLLSVLTAPIILPSSMHTAVHELTQLLLS